MFGRLNRRERFLPMTLEALRLKERVTDYESKEIGNNLVYHGEGGILWESGKVYKTV